jgi:hypothetical protein
MATTEAPAAIVVKGNTTEQVLRALNETTKSGPIPDPFPIIAELVARYDAKAAKRAAKGSGDDEAE